MAGARLDQRGVVVTCSSCGQNNRLPYAALTKSVRCAQCKVTLDAPAVPVEAPDAAAFHAAASESTLPLIVDFWAPGVAPAGWSRLNSSASRATAQAAIWWSS